jgi:hypothetical protein
LLDSVERAQTRIAGGREKDIRALFYLIKGQLFTFSGIVPCTVGHTYIIVQYFYIRVHIPGAFLVTGFELVDQRYVHPADKS